jgi:NAD(P)-dependent dehydrogenase (short-subunit alcohol dehydrogenase family)
MTPDTFREDFEVNVNSAFVATREAFKVMLPAQRGSIINISSINGLLGLGNMAAYGTAKAALIHFTRCAAIEAARANVRVNAIAPGVINTPATAAGFAGRVCRLGQKSPRKFRWAVSAKPKKSPASRHFWRATTRVTSRRLAFPPTAARPRSSSCRRLDRERHETIGNRINH